MDEWMNSGDFGVKDGNGMIKKVVWRRNKTGNKTEKSKNQKNNTKDSNVVPHRSTNLAR